MPTIKEFREFFLRSIKVNTGVKIDQELNFPLTYNITGKGNVFNRFLKNHFPSENVFKKLFESVTFKLNIEDTASISEQGLVKLATDQQSLDRTDSPVGQFSNVVRPSHLPNLIDQTIPVTDVVESTITNDGVIIQAIKSFTALRFKRNFVVKAKVDKSLAINLTTKAIELVNDLPTPVPTINDYNKYYGTNSVGSKGYHKLPSTTNYSIWDSYVGNPGLPNTTPIGIDTLHTTVIPANTLIDDGDEISIEVNSNYVSSGGTGSQRLVIGTLAHVSNHVAPDPYRIITKHKIIYLGGNQIAVYTELLKYDDINDTTFPYQIHKNIRAFDPTISNAISHQLENLSVEIVMYIERIKVTFGKIL